MNTPLRHGYRAIVFVILTIATAATHAAVDGVSKIVIRSHIGTGSDVIQIAEFTAIDAASGVDLATSALGASVSSSGFYNNDPDYGPDNAIDGLDAPGTDALSNYYHSVAAANQSLTVSFPGPVSLSALTLVGREDCCVDRDRYSVTLLDQFDNELLNLPDLDTSTFSAAHRATKILIPSLT